MAKEKRVKKERKKSTFWKDFKAFISRGNIVDLAVAVVVGAAFTAIVNSVVNDIIKPLITWLFGGEDMSDLVVVLREFTNDAGELEQVTLNYGNLIMAILTFLIDALVIFTIVRIIRNAQRKIKEGAEALKGKLEKDNGAAVEETVLIPHRNDLRHALQKDGAHVAFRKDAAYGAFPREFEFRPADLPRPAHTAV